MKSVWALFIALGVLGFIIYSGLTSNPTRPLPTSEPNVTMDELMEVDELIIEDTLEGTGDEAISGNTVTVHYSGTLTNGAKFDSSYDRGTPFTFTLGAGQVIEGWDLGVAGMKVGGKRKLTIPSKLAYGERGAPPDIPPGATLVFEVELLSIE